MKKKIMVLGLCFVMLVSLCSCGTSEKKKTVVMTVSGTQISSGVFAYYLDEVMSQPEKYGVELSDRQAVIDKATHLCRILTATKLFMQERKVRLATDGKQAAASRTETLWNLYSGYYKSVGVEKTDLIDVVTHEERMMSLLDYYFGAQGIKPVSEQELKERFVELYMGFRAVEGSLMKVNDAGETVPMTEKEKNALKKRFESYAQKINDGETTLDEVNVSYNSSLDLIVTGEIEATLMKKGDPMYAEDFFDKVNSISHTRAAVIESGSKIYLVQRERIATDEGDAFFTYREDVLREMKMSAVEKKTESLANKAECKVKSSRLKKIYDTVLDAKGTVQTSEE